VAEKPLVKAVGFGSLPALVRGLVRVARMPARVTKTAGSRVNWGALLAAIFLLALAAVTFAPARATNFRGYDEWLNVSMLSRGILGFPYANRPLGVVWGLPAWVLFPDRLVGFLVFHVAWIGLSGVLVFLLARRLSRGATAFAFLAGAFVIVWAPSDRSRLCSTQMILYSGCTFGAVLAAWLMTEAWLRRRLTWAAGAVAAGSAAVLSFEATLAPLSLVPLLFLVGGGVRERRRLAAWTMAVLGVVAAGGLRAALPRWTDPERVAYQTQGAPDLTPGPLVGRTLKQLRRHVAPVLELPPTERSWPVAPVALLVFAAGFVSASRRVRQGPDGQGEALPSRFALFVAGGVGLLWALASYVPFALNAQMHGSERMEFLSTPGVAVLLAAGVVGGASLFPSRARLAVAFLLGAWIVAGGVMRTAVLQADWDTRSAYPDQKRFLLELTSVAPDLAPGTLVLLLDSGSWALDLTFRHAVLYLYEGRAVGHAVGATEYLYETSFEATGVRSVPWRVLRGPWRESPTLYPYAAIVALREDARGRLHLLETWPADLPPLPPGATYLPRARVRLGPRLRRLEILGR
jgi:hypothetical protein